MRISQVALMANSIALVLMLGLGGASAARAATVTLNLPKVQGKSGETVEVPIGLKDAKGMSAFQAVMVYDPAVLELVSEGGNVEKAFSKGKALPENALTHVAAGSAGRLAIVFVGGADAAKKTMFSVQEDGTLGTLKFRVIGKSGQKSALSLEKAEAFGLNDMDMLVRSEAGEVGVVGGLPFEWWWIALGVGVLIVLWLLMRRKEPARQTVARGGEPELVAVPLDEPMKHTCVKCGRVIAVPAGLVGKGFRCPGCGTAQTVGR
jgi:hypothetical protein